MHEIKFLALAGFHGYWGCCTFSTVILVMNMTAIILGYKISPAVTSAHPPRDEVVGVAGGMD